MLIVIVVYLQTFLLNDSTSALMMDYLEPKLGTHINYTVPLKIAN